MKIISATWTLLFFVFPAAFAADPDDLHTRVGTDPTPAELIADGAIVPGERWSTRTVVGSGIVVNHALLDLETGVLGPVSSISGVHIPVSGRRSDYQDITRWYQLDGNTQVFRLFQGEHNYRYGNVGDDPVEWFASAPPSRVEAVSPTLAVASGTWREWQGTYTIIHPLRATIFQLFHQGADLWSFHLGMSGSGDISFNRRNSIPGLPDQIMIAENMVGKSLAIKVRANGFDYEVYRKFPLVDEGWSLLTVGSYQQSPTEKVIFRWGMYPGSQPGSTSNDGMLFVSGATTRVSTEPAAPPPPPPVTYHWDSNGAAPGFGTAAGTWAAPTDGDATQGWSVDPSGATEPVDTTTTTIDPVNFGVGSTGLGAGTITVSGTVESGDLSFASGSGSITLSGGSITLPDTATVQVNNNVAAGNVIESVMGGAAISFTVAGSRTVALNGLNTFTGATVIGSAANSSLRARINSIRDVSGGASSLGAPTSASKGIIQIGSVSYGSTLELTGSTSAQSTDRRVRVGSNSNGSGGATILNNNTEPAHTLAFSDPAFNVAATGISNTNRTLTLGGTNAGDNIIAGAIIDNVGGSGGKVALAKSGSGTWVLAGASTYSNPTGINAGTLKIGADHVLPHGAGRGSVNVNGGANAGSTGTLDLNGFDLAVNGLGGTAGTVAGRVVNDAAGTQGTLTVGNGDANGTFNGIIADNISGTGTIALTKVGGGTQTLTGPNSYTGATTVGGGALVLGNGGSIADSAAVFVAAGAVLDVTANPTHAIPAGQPLTFGIDASDGGSAGTLAAAHLDITHAGIDYDLSGMLDDPVYVLATYSSLTGTEFASKPAPPAGYALRYGYEGDKIALVLVGDSPYEAWANGVAFGDDENGDGLSNGLAFLLGAADPDSDEPGLPPTVAESAGGLVLTFRMRNATSRGGATLSLHHSSDLGLADPWTSVAVPDESGGPFDGVTFIVTEGDPLNTVEATISANEAADGKLFGRLEANDGP